MDEPAPDPVSAINTYHCICTTPLLATTHSLASLPRRRPPCLDQAIILPLPAPQSHSANEISSSEGETDDENDNDDAGEGDNQHMQVEGVAALNPARSLQDRRKRRRRRRRLGVGYSLLLSTTQDRKPVVIRGEDGFEKRLLLRCGRCRLVVGYKLDHHPALPGGGEGVREGEAGLGTGLPNERREDSGIIEGLGEIIYLLPGGLVTTADMAAGRAPEVTDWERVKA